MQIPHTLSGSIPASLVAGSNFYVHPPKQSPPNPEVVLTELSVSKFEDSAEANPTNYFQVKHAVDWIVTAAMMTLAIPIMLIVGLLILVCDGRPIMFRQVRVGEQGRLFGIWKFRTMRRGAEDQTGAVWSSDDDLRVTRLGQWLRCSHLDELPQFINILCGDMNLVGPRPERPEFVKTLAKEVPGYDQRHQVRPGTTGLAQLRLGYDQSIAGIPEKLDCDLEYIREASLIGDAALLSKTLPHIAMQLHQRWSSRRVGKTRSQSIRPRRKAPSQARKRSVSKREQTFSTARVNPEIQTTSRCFVQEEDAA